LATLEESKTRARNSETVNDLLALVQLEEHRKKYPSQLSGGSNSEWPSRARSLTTEVCFLTNRSAPSTRNASTARGIRAL